jgi:hypothetical protein
MNILTRPVRLGFAVAVALAASGSAFAAGHFVRGPTASISNDGNITVTWKEAGLGDTVNVAYELSADANAKYQCVNHGGKCPSASNKQQVFGPVLASGTFASGKNGSITASLTAEPPAATLICPGNQVLQLVSVSYTDITLADTTNDVVALASPSSLGFSGPECP